MTAETFLTQLVRRYGRHAIYTDRAVWYHETCKNLGLRHILLDDEYRSLVERAIQYFKDRTEAFDDHFPCRRHRYRLIHVHN